MLCILTSERMLAHAVLFSSFLNVFHCFRPCQCMRKQAFAGQKIHNTYMWFMSNCFAWLVKVLLCTFFKSFFDVIQLVLLLIQYHKYCLTGVSHKAIRSHEIQDSTWIFFQHHAHDFLARFTFATGFCIICVCERFWVLQPLLFQIGPVYCEDCGA